MFARSLRNYGRIIFKRFQHTAEASTSEAAPFTNKFGFDLNPPPVHEYWNIRNSSVAFAFVPVFLGIAFFAKYIGKSVDTNGAYLGFADSEASPVSKIPFGQAQETPKHD